MKLLKYLFAAVLALSLATSAKNLDQKYVQYRLAKAEVELIFPDGATCSGTWVGSHTVLTAEHCFTGEARIHERESFDDGEHEVSLSGHVPTTIRHIETDGSDHVLATVDESAPTLGLPVVQLESLKQGTEITVIGHPGGRANAQLEFGTVTGWDDFQKKHCTVLDLSSFPGVSGEALVDWRGRILGVVSFASERGESLAIPLDFSPAQLSSIK